VHGAVAEQIQYADYPHTSFPTAPILAARGSAVP
jgi:hypothetical protein